MENNRYLDVEYIFQSEMFKVPCGVFMLTNPSCAYIQARCTLKMSLLKYMQHFSFSLQPQSACIQYLIYKDGSSLCSQLETALQETHCE